MCKHFLDLFDHSAEELLMLLDKSRELKAVYQSGRTDRCLESKSMVMLFEKPSMRTRISFEVGMTDLGGSAINVRPDDIGGLIGEREPISDMTRVLNGYCDVIVARTFGHNVITEIAKHATIPVINALTDECHPCQAMADMLTIIEHCGGLSGKKVTYIGDGNNMSRSLAVVCAKLGLHFTIAAPSSYDMPASFYEKVRAISHTEITSTEDVKEAVKDADIIYTDTWTSMGQEEEKAQRIKDFSGFCINADLLAAAQSTAKIMHCLPAYRDLEITNDVINATNSVIFEQAHNRLHFQRALLKYLITGN